MNPSFLMAADNNYLKTVLSEGRADTQMTAWKAAAAGISDAKIGKIIEYLTKERPQEKPAPFGFAKFIGKGFWYFNTLKRRRSTMGRSLALQDEN